MKKFDKTKTMLMAGLLLIVVLGAFIYFSYFKNCTVTFTLKIGAGIKTQEVRVGDKVKEPDTPVADGFIFEGWYLDGKLYNFDEPVKKDINLEAKWTQKEDKQM